ncbi:hypothetical protein HZQ89_17910 [Elizabethkingia anophelis]|nr:hypothetical protein [Elizabethkingia anophelis]
MKKILQLLLVIVVTVSCTNYYSIILMDDTPLYSGANQNERITTIPKNTQVYISRKDRKTTYKRIKWSELIGWSYNPVYTSIDSRYPYSSDSYYTPSSSSSSGGSVHVRGYYRKDGTYVSPHTRRSPRR